MKSSLFHKTMKSARFSVAAFEREVKAALKAQENKICQLFMDAVNNFDGEKIIEIAEAVWFFKPFFNDPVRPIKFNDPERTRLLFAKAKLMHKGEKWTIRQVAEYLNGYTKVETPADGFSALRRKCKALGFPLAESRKTRLKKSS